MRLKSEQRKLSGFSDGFASVYGKKAGMAQTDATCVQDVMSELEHAQPDRRTTAELIETAFIEAWGSQDQPEAPSAIGVLHARATREILGAALTLCQSLDPRRRALGAEILGQLGPAGRRAFPEECCAALLDLLRRDSDRDVLCAAVFALGHLGDRRCEPDLVVFGSHPDPVIRHGVAFALCGATAPLSVQALLTLMEDPYELARDWATTSIGRTVSIDGSEIRAALLRRVADEDEITRAEALHGLARRHDARAAPLLIAELSSAGEFTHLFADAAKTFLGFNVNQEAPAAALVAALQTKMAKP